MERTTRQISLLKKYRWWLGGAGGATLITIIVLATWPEPTRIAPKRGPIVEAVYALGTVRSNKVYVLKMGITTGINKLYIGQGDTVKKDRPLLATVEGTVMTAPFTGTVTRLWYNEGESVTPGSPILTLVDLKDRYIELSLDQNSALRIKRKQKATLSFEHLRGKTFLGNVNKLFPSEGEFFVHISVDKLPEAILPDMTADVAVEVTRREDVLLIPLTAVKQGYVMRYRSGKNKKVKVDVGAIDGRWVEVLDDSILESDEVRNPY